MYASTCVCVFFFLNAKEFVTGGVLCLFILVADAGTSFCWRIFYKLQPDFILYFKLCEIKSKEIHS